METDRSRSAEVKYITCTSWGETRTLLNTLASLVVHYSTPVCYQKNWSWGGGGG